MYPATRILSNQVFCLKCEDAPFSGHRHDYRTCRCGNVSVDGGTAYLRRTFETKEWKDVSIEWTEEKYEKVTAALTDLYAADDMSLVVEKWIELEGLGEDMIVPLTKAAEWAKSTQRNLFGLICALARTERDGDFYV